MAPKKGGDARNFNENPLYENDPMRKGLNEERALHHINQAFKKRDFLYKALQRVQNQLTAQEIASYDSMITNFMKLERDIALMVQKTAEDFNAARDIKDPEKRRQYVESIKHQVIKITLPRYTIDVI